MDPSIKQIDYLFSPRSVAVIGASNDAGKWGFGVIQSVLKDAGRFTVYPVNPKAAEVYGLKAFKRVTDIKGDLDFAVIVIPPEHVPAAMEDCVAKRVKAVLVITAGFRETGGEGAELESVVMDIARKGKIRVVGPNCNGHFNASHGLFTTRSGKTLKGPIGLVSQSGNFGGYILGNAAERGIGFSKYVSSGNEADLTIEDYFEYLAEDPETKIICAYIEGLKDAHRFFKIAGKITRKKPIIIMKVGRTLEGASAAMSHTGSLSGSDQIHDAAFKQAGIIRVTRVDHMLDIASALIRQPVPRGNRVGIVTGGGGFGVVATDACRSLGLEIPSLKKETIEKLNKILPPRWPHANPVDMAGTGLAPYHCMGNLLKADNIDIVLGVSNIGFVASVPDDAPPDARAKIIKYQKMIMEGESARVQGLIERMETHGKPVIITSVPSSSESGAIAELNRNSIFTYRAPEDGARVISYLVNYGRYLAHA